MKPNENPNIRDLPEHYIVLDIETTGLLPWYGDQVTCICAKCNMPDIGNFAMTQPGTSPFSSGNEKYLLEDFRAFLGRAILNKEDKLVADVFMITKNGKEFDVPFLLSRMLRLRGSVPYPQILQHIYHFDLHHVTSKWVGLQQMAELYGVDQKSGTGENAIKLWNEGRLDELKEYCWQDVLTTEQVFLKWKELHSQG